MQRGRISSERAPNWLTSQPSNYCISDFLLGVVCARHPLKRYVSDTPRYLKNTWGVRHHRSKLVRSQKPKYLQTPLRHTRKFSGALGANVVSAPYPPRGVCRYFGFWLLTSFGRWRWTPQVFSRYRGVSGPYPPGVSADTLAFGF